MKKAFLFFIVILPLSFFAKSQQLAIDSNNREVKSIAILPAVVSLDPKNMSGNPTPEIIRASEEANGLEIQTSEYTRLRKREHKYTVIIQDIDVTNALLKKAGISAKDLLTADKVQLCKTLGVDALFYTKANLSHPNSKGESLGKMFLRFKAGATNKTVIFWKIIDYKGKIVWQRDDDDMAAKPTDEITDPMIQKMVKRFPYKE